jgi:hypothetical protein
MEKGLRERFVFNYRGRGKILFLARGEEYGFRTDEQTHGQKKKGCGEIKGRHLQRAEEYGLRSTVFAAGNRMPFTGVGVGRGWDGTSLIPNLIYPLTGEISHLEVPDSGGAVLSPGVHPSRVLLKSLIPTFTAIMVTQCPPRLLIIRLNTRSSLLIIFVKKKIPGTCYLTSTYSFSTS